MVEVSLEPYWKTPVSKPVFNHDQIAEVANRFGTPIYLIDEATLRRKVSELESAYSGYSGPVRVAYSMKANFNPSMVKIFISEGILFDVTSLGELYFFKRSGGSSENVIYTSVTEQKSEFIEVLKSGVARIVVSSFNGLQNLIESAEELNIKPRVLVRINPEVGVKAEVRASYRHGKFGVPFNTSTPDSASRLLTKILHSSSLIFEGFHFHLGSQIEDPVCFVNALEKLQNFVQKMRREFPELKIETVDIGGGTPVYYGRQVPTPDEIGRIVTKRLNSMAENLQSHFTVIVESGRYLSAEACLLISRIVNTKIYAAHKFVFLDVGYHLLLDAALLHQEYPQEVVPNSAFTENLKISLAGRLCDTYDIFPISQSSNLSGAETGKLVVFHNVGAYSIVFNMPFHCQTRPAIVMRKVGGEYVLVRRAERIDDLFVSEGGEIVFDPYERSLT